MAIYWALCTGLAAGTATAPVTAQTRPVVAGSVRFTSVALPRGGAGHKTPTVSCGSAEARGATVSIQGEQMHNTDDHEADALPQAQGKKEPMKEMTFTEFLDANDSDNIEGFESMDELADPQPRSFYRPAGMGKVLVHVEKRGPAFEPKADDEPEQDEAEARAEAAYRKLDRGEL